MKDFFSNMMSDFTKFVGQDDMSKKIRAIENKINELKKQENALYFTIGKKAVEMDGYEKFAEDGRKLSETIENIKISEKELVDAKEEKVRLEAAEKARREAEKNAASQVATTATVTSVPATSINVDTSAPATNVNVATSVQGEAVSTEPAYTEPKETVINIETADSVVSVNSENTIESAVYEANVQDAQTENVAQVVQVEESMEITENKVTVEDEKQPAQATYVVKCHNCGETYDKEIAFCQKCGTKIEKEVSNNKFCSQCGAENVNTAKFCSKCGNQF